MDNLVNLFIALIQLIILRYLMIMVTVYAKLMKKLMIFLKAEMLY